jgi:arylsulfatase A-like enzyme
MKANILLIVIDSFNANKFYGEHKTSKTPNIDLLIKNGTFFTQATSSADATLLSTTSLFTGKYPFKTGIRSPKLNKLRDDVVTYFDILQKNGYHLYAYRPTLQENDDLFPKFENDDSLYDVFQNLSDGLGNKIINMLNGKTMEEPWFFFIHPHDLHQPIIISKGFEDEKYGSSNYEKQVSAVDYWIGKILEQIDLTKTLLIITADHGSYVKSLVVDGKTQIEADGKTQMHISQFSNKLPKFLDPIKNKLFFAIEASRQRKKEQLVSKLNVPSHVKRNLMAGRFTTEHSVFDDQVRIPLLFAGFGTKKGIKISQQVRNVDIFPTICNIVEIANQNDVDGISLKPLIEGSMVTEPPAYLESNPLILKKSNDVIGVRTSKYKYFRDKKDHTKRVHLYNLQDDPFEDNNIAQERSDVVNEMETMLQDIVKEYSLD